MAVQGKAGVQRDSQSFLLPVVHQALCSRKEEAASFLASRAFWERALVNGSPVAVSFALPFVAVPWCVYLNLSLITGLPSFLA